MRKYTLAKIISAINMICVIQIHISIIKRNILKLVCMFFPMCSLMLFQNVVFCGHVLFFHDSRSGST